MTVYRLPQCDLFASGQYRGTTWPASVVRTIAQNMKTLGPSGSKQLIPPVVLGHEENQDWLERTDLPAAGWVDADTVSVVQDPANPQEVILRADVVNVPQQVADLIRSGQFMRGSGEFYEFQNDFGEKLSGYTMRRFGLLGAEVPQVKRLRNLPTPVAMAAMKQFAESRLPAGGRLVLSFAESSGRPALTPAARIEVGKVRAFAEKIPAKQLRAVNMTVERFVETATALAARNPSFKASELIGDAATATITPVDRNQLYETIRLVMPRISTGTLDALNDDQLKEFVMALPTAKPAAA